MFSGFAAIAEGKVDTAALFPGGRRPEPVREEDNPGDISEEAGINLALLNYYYRSKEKLFVLVMTEILQNFF